MPFQLLLRLDISPFYFRFCAKRFASSRFIEMCWMFSSAGWPHIFFGKASYLSVSTEDKHEVSIQSNSRTFFFIQPDLFFVRQFLILFPIVFLATFFCNLPFMLSHFLYGFSHALEIFAR